MLAPGIAFPPVRCYITARTAGCAITGVIRFDQPLTTDMSARVGKRLESLPAAIMDDVLARLSVILT